MRCVSRRRIYDNLRKAMGFIFGVHVPIAVIAILPLAFGTPLVLGPIQIALLEMIIDPGQRLLSLEVVGRGIIQGLLAAAALMALYLAGAWAGLATAELRTLTFFALVAAVLALVLANRSFSTSFAHALVRGNLAFRYVLAFVTAGSAAILIIAPARRVLEFAPLGWTQLAIVAGVGAALLVALEATKRAMPSRQSDPDPDAPTSG